MKESLYRNSRYNDMAVKLQKKSLYRVNLKELNDKKDKVDKEAYNIASFSYIIVHSGWQKRWRLLDYCNVIVLKFNVLLKLW